MKEAPRTNKEEKSNTEENIRAILELPNLGLVVPGILKNAIDLDLSLQSLGGYSSIYSNKLNTCMEAMKTIPHLLQSLNSDLLQDRVKRQYQMTTHNFV